jgi:hypothetical protein
LQAQVLNGDLVVIDPAQSATEHRNAISIAVRGYNGYVGLPPGSQPGPIKVVSPTTPLSPVSPDPRQRARKVTPGPGCAAVRLDLSGRIVAAVYCEFVTGTARVLAGDGDDVVFVNTELRPAAVHGGPGADMLDVDVARQVSTASPATYTLADSRAVVNGGAGNDTLRLAGAWVEATGDDGADVFNMNEKFDYVRSRHSYYGGRGDDVMFGALIKGADRISGNRQCPVPKPEFDPGGYPDTVPCGLKLVHSADMFADGGEGNDRIFGMLAVTTAHGGIGNDTVVGSPFKDTLYGDQGEDYVHGAESIDTVDGGPDADMLYGGPSIDKLFARDGVVDKVVNCGGGANEHEKAVADRSAPIKDPVRNC